MGKSRYAHDCLATANEPRWFTVRDSYGEMIAAVRIEPNSDLKQLIRWIAEGFRSHGWTVESEDFKYGGFYCNRRGVRLFVDIKPTDPWKPLPVMTRTAR